MKQPPEPYEDPYKGEPEKRDGHLLRWAKFVSVIFVFPVLAGILFSLDPAIFGFESRSSRGRKQTRVTEEQRKQAAAELGPRFLVGAGAGAVFGIGYVVWCIRKREDP